MAFSGDLAIATASRSAASVQVLPLIEAGVPVEGHGNMLNSSLLKIKPQLGRLLVE